jgi:hypothetical protein
LSSYLFYRELKRDTLTSLLRSTRALLDARVEEHLSDADTHTQRASSYDPGVVFLLELMLSITMHGRDYLSDLW